MAGQLRTISLAAPSFAGINTQTSPLGLNYQFSLEANNCVIDKYGRIGSRKGVVKLSTSADTITSLSEIKDNTGVYRTFYTANKKLYVDGVDITPTATIVSDDWEVAQFNSKLYLFNSQNDPIVVWHNGTAFTASKVTAHPNYVASVQKGSTVTAAYGRLWYGFGQSLYWSDLLIGEAWGGGSSGYINLDKVWADGTDEVVKVVDHNGFLVIFGKRQILVYKGANEPATMSIEDKIVGVGCSARDSVQQIGDDVLFLSSSGVKSLNRTIQQKSLPLLDISKNVKSDLLDSFSSSNKVKSVYADKEGLYLLAFDNKLFAFNTSARLEDGTFKVTTWTGLVNGTSFYQCKSGDLYIGKLGVYKYSGYLDDTAKYTMKFTTGHLDFDQPFSIKMLKKLGVTTIGGSGTLVKAKWSFDYTESFKSTSRAQQSNSTYYYGASEYGVAEFSSGVFTVNNTFTTSGSGTTLQVSVEADINSLPLSIQKIDIYALIGRGIS